MHDYKCNKFFSFLQAPRVYFPRGADKLLSSKSGKRCLVMSKQNYNQNNPNQQNNNNQNQQQNNNNQNQQNSNNNNQQN